MNSGGSTSNWGHLWWSQESVKRLNYWTVWYKISTAVLIVIKSLPTEFSLMKNKNLFPFFIFIIWFQSGMPLWTNFLVYSNRRLLCIIWHIIFKILKVKSNFYDQHSIASQNPSTWNELKTKVIIITLQILLENTLVSSATALLSLV